MTAFTAPLTPLSRASFRQTFSYSISECSSIRYVECATRRRSFIRSSADNGNAGNNRSSKENGQTIINSRNIELMACDLDGTFLDKTTQATEANIDAVKRLMADTDVLFMPATGKSRPGALNAMGSLANHLQCTYPNGCPGVYLQGLLVFGTDGSVVYENECDAHLSGLVVSLAKELELTLIAYSRDSIVFERRTDFVDMVPIYKEPIPIRIDSWESAIGNRPLNKFIFMAEPEEINRIRPIVEERVGTSGVLTQAQGNMLEVLPPLSSKGTGLKKLLIHLGIDEKNVLAIGDAENDVEMLEMVGYSCAVANALPIVKKAAKYTDLPSNVDSGVASAIERFFFDERAVKV